MLSPETIRTAIILMKRAPLKGEESMNAANAIIECEKALQKIAQDAQKQQEFDLELDEE